MNGCQWMATGHKTTFIDVNYNSSQMLIIISSQKHINRFIGINIGIVMLKF
jgi:hypothetical protein